MTTTAALSATGLSCGYHGADGPVLDGLELSDIRTCNKILPRARDDQGLDLIVPKDLGDAFAKVLH